MTYSVELDDQASFDMLMHKKAGNKILLKKIERLLEELKSHPAIGTGKPHRLKHMESEIWSRSIDEGIVTVFVISLWGHYGDK